VWLGNDYGGEESLGCEGKLGAAVEKGSGGEVVTAAVEFTNISCWKLAVGGRGGGRGRGSCRRIRSQIGCHWNCRSGCGWSFGGDCGLSGGRCA